MLDRRDTDQVQRGWGAEGAPPPSAAADDKSADQRAFRFLQEIAGELSGGAITFPTFIDATVKVRNALSDPNIDAVRLAQVSAASPCWRPSWCAWPTPPRSTRAAGRWRMFAPP